MISKKQKQILAFQYSKKYKALICDGAVRTGKTAFITIAFVDWDMSNFNRRNFAICGRSVGSAIKNVIEPYINLDYTKQKYDIKFKRYTKELVLTKGDVTNIFHIFGGGEENSYMSIQGLTCAGAYFDEVALLKESFVMQALAKTITFDNAKYWF